MPPVVVGAAIGAAASTAIGYYVTGTIVDAITVPVT